MGRGVREARVTLIRTYGSLNFPTDIELDQTVSPVTASSLVYSGAPTDIELDQTVNPTPSTPPFREVQDDGTSWSMGSGGSEMPPVAAPTPHRSLSLPRSPPQPLVQAYFL